ncbi:SDR family NAD(P)-dependent oxidoreductase [Cytophagaceae bacterium 50C-KIRBA]|uniref:SDR family NAD(P)-dependent oxidoreductase n=1 Tax=Aquirufa beregesia TaxID=2516556 RepID=A0ABX0EWA2_9BACT|nr:SDR family NAD(P)-dependent oxidoreductase [Aquirufa beregesia]NGZ43596.1 SDR family NAD(P)-dependent oxidoreductase [Aquirufa beregesia]
MNVKNKTILITGGSAGIGLEAAKQFLELGTKVIITGRNQDKLDTAKTRYPDLIAIKSDVAKEEDAMALYKQIELMGGIDILYNNAGVGVMPSNLGVANDKHVRGAVYEMDINYIAVIRLNNLFMNMLNSREEGAIINTTSVLSYVPSLLEATYSATKTALGFYTKSLREHLRIANSPVKVFELLPPAVETELIAHRKIQKMSPEKLIKGLIMGLQKNQYTIRMGYTGVFYFLNRIFPKLAFALVNPKNAEKYLK